jgi:hypothetical protein
MCTVRDILVYSNQGLEVERHKSRMREVRNAYKILVRKPEKKARDHLGERGVGNVKSSLCLTN